MFISFCVLYSGAIFFSCCIWDENIWPLFVVARYNELRCIEVSVNRDSTDLCYCTGIGKYNRRFKLYCSWDVMSHYDNDIALYVIEYWVCLNLFYNISDWTQPLRSEIMWDILEKAPSRSLQNRAKITTKFCYYFCLTAMTWTRFSTFYPLGKMEEPWIVLLCSRVWRFYSLKGITFAKTCWSHCCHAENLVMNLGPFWRFLEVALSRNSLIVSERSGLFHSGKFWNVFEFIIKFYHRSDTVNPRI